MGDTLKNAPVVEAVCEFRFDPAAAWDWAIPGQMFEKIRTEFPEKAEVRSLGVQIQFTRETLPSAAVNTGPERILFKRRDGSAIVQLGKSLLAISQLRPYPKWEVFRDLILRTYSTHAEIAGQAKVQRIGLRYINRIPCPPGEVQFSDYITLDPPLTGPLDRPLGNFYQRYEISQETPPGMLIHQTGLLRESGQDVILLLDLDFVSLENGALPEEHRVTDWLDAAHERIHEAFVSSLSGPFYERLRKGAV
jgi:uncharacterized protein (TIGR04255 family)